LYNSYCAHVGAYSYPGYNARNYHFLYLLPLKIYQQFFKNYSVL
jgi:hypothetical protein